MGINILSKIESTSVLLNSTFRSGSARNMFYMTKNLKQPMRRTALPSG